MAETLYHFLEEAVSPTNVLLQLLLAIISSTLVTMAVHFSNRGSPRRGIHLREAATFVVSVFVCVLAWAAVRDKVSTHRQERIRDLFVELDHSPSFRGDPGSRDIRDWRTGLAAIRANPGQVGYYAQTAELLQREHDLQSAILLLELGMNHIDNPPLTLCSQLGRYYVALGLRDRPGLRGCEKIIQL